MYTIFVKDKLGKKEKFFFPLCSFRAFLQYFLFILPALWAVWESTCMAWEHAMLVVVVNIIHNVVVAFLLLKYNNTEREGALEKKTQRKRKIATMNGLREKVSENFHAISFGIRTHRKKKCGRRRRRRTSKKVSQRKCYCAEKAKKNSGHFSCEALTQCVWVRKILFRPQPRSPSSLFYHFVVSGGLFREWVEERKRCKSTRKPSRERKVNRDYCECRTILSDETNFEGLCRKKLGWNFLFSSLSPPQWHWFFILILRSHTRISQDTFWRKNRAKIFSFFNVSSFLVLSSHVAMEQKVFSRRQLTLIAMLFFTTTK